MANPNPFANMGGGGGNQSQSNSNVILGLHRLRNKALIEQHKKGFVSNVNVDVSRHQQEQQTSLQTYLTTEMTPMAGQPDLQRLITEGNTARALAAPTPADLLTALKGTAAQAINVNLANHQDVLRRKLSEVNSKLERRIKIITDKTSQKIISSELHDVIQEKQVHLNNLAVAKNEAIASVNQLYTDAHRDLLKTAYGIDNAQVERIKAQHVEKVSEEYNKQITNAKTYINKVRDDYQAAEKKLNDDFYIRLAYEKFIVPNLSQAERNEIASVGGEVTTEDMKRALDSTVKFKTTVGGGNFGQTGNILERALGTTYFWQNQDGKLGIKVKDLNPQSMRDMLLLLKSQGKSTATLTLPPEDEHNKEQHKQLRAMFAIEAAKLGMTVPGHAHSLKEMELIRHIQASQERIEQSTANRETPKDIYRDILFRATDKINAERTAISSLSGEMRTIHAVAAADPSVQAKGTQIIAATGRNDRAGLVADRDRLLGELQALTNQLENLETRTPRARPSEIDEKRKELEAKERQIDKYVNLIQLKDALDGGGNPEETKDRVLLALYHEVKERRQRLASGIDDGFTALERLGNIDLSLVTDRAQRQGIIDTLNSGLATINDGINAEKAIHTIPANPPGAPPADLSVQAIIDARATIAPGAAPTPANGDLVAARDEINQFQNNVVPEQETKRDTEDANQNTLQGQMRPRGP